MTHGTDAVPFQQVRPPVLHPAPVPRAWASSEWRVLVDGRGDLRLRGPGCDDVLARQGDVHQVLLVEPGTRTGRRRLPEHGPSLLLLLREAPPIALPLVDWAPGQLAEGPSPTGARLAELLTVTGIRALVAALGAGDPWAFELERADLHALRRGRSAQVVTPVHAAERFAPRATAAGVAFAATYALTGVWATLDPMPGEAVARFQNVFGLAALSTVFAIGAWHLLRARSRALRPLQSVQDSTGLLPGGVQVGALAGGDLLVADPFGLESVLPGAASGGVAVAVAGVQQGVGLRSLALHPQDADGRPETRAYLVLDSSWWAHDEQASSDVRRILEGAGVRVQEVRVPRAAPREPAVDVRRLPDLRWPAEVLRPVTASAVVGAVLGLLVDAPVVTAVLAVGLGLLWLLRLRDLWR